MSTLFILNQPELLDDCITVMQPDDALLLIENAVVIATKSSTTQYKMFVLKDDLIARGLFESIHDQSTAIDFSKFVELTLAYDKSVSWL